MIRILIIDDDKIIRENTSEILELEGYSTLTASNGNTGLEKIMKHMPDLILCDLRMPEMDGFTLLGHLGQHLELKRIPFIFFSAKAEKADVKAGIDAGAVGYLTKPFELKDLLASIEKCLNSKRLST